jgi:acyl-CoA reductase-like NAD-dependent aldehyde dehydrogenase
VAALLRLAEHIELQADEIAELLTREQGKPLAAAKMEVSCAPRMIRYFAGPAFAPEVVEDTGSRRVGVHRRPLGVVAGIVPWNFPFLMAVYKLAPAVLVGNSFVLKPAPTTPLTALLLGELVRELVPAGVVNVLADGGELGPLLTAHPAVGRVVMASGADTVKRATPAVRPPVGRVSTRHTALVRAWLSG